VEAEGDVATAFTLARIISNIPLARGGPGGQLFCSAGSMLFIVAAVVLPLALALGVCCAAGALCLDLG